MTDKPTDTTAHHCPTGYHQRPDRNCYEKHQCRCGRCRHLKVAANRESAANSRTRVTINVDHSTWLKLERGLRRRGMTVEQFMRQAAERFTA